MGRGSNSTVRSSGQRARSQHAEQESSPVQWPEVRILRKTFIHPDFDSSEWSYFLDDVGSRNYGKGQVKTLGSMALTYVDAQSMGRMLNKKFDKTFSSRRRAPQIIRGFAADYNRFVRSCEEPEKDKAFLESMAPLAVDDGIVAVTPDHVVFSNDFTPKLPGTYEDDLGHNPAERYEYQESLRLKWKTGEVEVGGIDQFGNKLGLLLNDDGQIQEERNATISWLKNEGLDTRLLSAQADGSNVFKPHCTFYTPYNPAGLAITYAAMLPDTIQLSAPSAEALIYK